MDNIAIKVDRVSKTFKLPHEKSTSIKSTIVNFWRREKGYELQKALNNISFDIKKGEFFGIVGRNGSGKSTLLKLLAGIYMPDSGNIQVNGKLTPFIELGVGFSPELTGRENVYLNGSLLGFNRNEMNAMYNDIVEFAEIERFMDQKLKNYSTGMQVRLAFSIAIRAQTDILVLDEVLAVGDGAFQQKCNDYFEKQKANKQTIILVTHEMKNVKKYCTRAMLINDGETIMVGDAEIVAAKYNELNKNKESHTFSDSMPSNSIGLEAYFTNTKGVKTRDFTIGENVDLHISWNEKDVKVIGVAIYKQTGERIYATNTLQDEFTVNEQSCVYRVKLNVAQGKYTARIRAYNEDLNDTMAVIEQTHPITINPDKKMIEVDGITPLQHSWMSRNDKSKKGVRYE